jgi:hypothetical protein
MSASSLRFTTLIVGCARLPQFEPANWRDDVRALFTFSLIIVFSPTSTQPTSPILIVPFKQTLFDILKNQSQLLTDTQTQKTLIFRKLYNITNND